MMQLTILFFKQKNRHKNPIIRPSPFFVGHYFDTKTSQIAKNKHFMILLRIVLSQL